MDSDEVFNRILMDMLFTDSKNKPIFHHSNIIQNNLKSTKESIKYIECDCPEIGTKIENMDGKTTDLKKYYENSIKKMFFYPFFDMNKGHYNKKNKFKIAYFIDDLYDLFLFKQSYEEEVKMQIKNKSIIQIIYSKVLDKIELYFFLKTPPKVFVKDNNITPVNYIEKFKRSLGGYTYDNLYRNVDPKIPVKYFAVKHMQQYNNNNKKANNFFQNKIINKEPSHFQREVSYFSRDNEFENLYLNDLVIKISFKNNYRNKEFFKSLKNKFKSMKVKVKNNKYYYEKIESVDSEQKNIIKKILTKKTNTFYHGFQKLIPNLQFALMSLLTIQQINIFSFNLDILKFLYCEHSSMQERSVKIIEEMTNRKNYTNIGLDYKTFFDDFNSFSSINWENNYDKTKSITITPSKIIYNITTQSTSNHFQRKLKVYNDNIIKFTIVDEDNNCFSISDINKSNKLLLFIKSVLKDGVILGSCQYNYIGSSNSQMKNLGGWMVNLEGIRIYKDEYLTSIKNDFKLNKIFNSGKEIYFSRQIFENCDEIINMFGDFSKELNIFKHASRKGMIFSDSKYVTDVNIYNVLPLEDEKIGEYIITDGIGKISSDLMELAAKKWGINNLNQKPISAIQIRFMGCKGVFAVDPFLQENTVHYRESQKKFESDDTALNICSVANYKEACLNRQFIILLSSLGVKDEIFEKIEDGIIKKYNELLVDPYKAMNCDKSLYYEFKSILLRFVPVFEDLFKKEKKVNLIDEPLISQFLNIFVYSKLINIKYNGKLNDKRCVCLMGVLDETNTLKENEVYVHLVHSTEYSRINKVLNQKITVYRSPSLYPGDIKILTAVNKPELSHMINVIVFSKKGKRPTFNKLSGGDLDGDRYFILFNDYITTNIKDTNCSPLEDPKYSIKSNNNQINKKITIDDTINCMITSVQNDLVGLICDNHMALADNSDLKAKDPRCIKLCKYFNQEIDAPKNGNFIPLSTLQEENLISRKRPDFLSNGILNKNTFYNSNGILGKLYRQIDRRLLFEKIQQNFFEKAIRKNYEINLKYITKDCFKFLPDAYLIYEKYKDMICKLMYRYNFCTEGELFLNMRIIKNNRAYRGRSDSSMIELNNIIDYIYKELIKVFKVIDLNVASAVYVASYINIKKVHEKSVVFTEYYQYNVAILISLFEEEKNEFKKLFKEYQEYDDLKHSKNRVKDMDNNKLYKNKYKRIFSLPWVIKEVRNLLMKI